MTQEISEHLYVLSPKLLEVYIIKLLKKEQTLHRVDMVEAKAGHPPPAQRRSYLNCNQRITAIVGDYPNRNNMRYLRGIARNFRF